VRPAAYAEPAILGEHPARFQQALVSRRAITPYNASGFKWFDYMTI
jgi:hypothetical protein